MARKLGSWAFIIGVILAVLAGLMPTMQTPTVTWVLVILGLIVGFLNITERETVEFLVAAVALLIAGSAGSLPALGTVILAILENIVAFVAPAALVVALKAIYSLAQA